MLVHDVTTFLLAWGWMASTLTMLTFSMESWAFFSLSLLLTSIALRACCIYVGDEGKEMRCNSFMIREY